MGYLYSARVFGVEVKEIISLGTYFPIVFNIPRLFGY